MKIECDQKGGVKMEESHNFYLNDYTEFVKQATDIIESNKNSKNYVIMYADFMWTCFFRSFFKTIFI